MNTVNDEIMTMPFDQLNRKKVESLTSEQARHLEERLTIFIRRGGNMWTARQRAFLYEMLHHLGEAVKRDDA